MPRTQVYRFFPQTSHWLQTQNKLKISIESTFDHKQPLGSRHNPEYYTEMTEYLKFHISYNQWKIGDDMLGQ